MIFCRLKSIGPSVVKGHNKYDTFFMTITITLDVSSNNNIQNPTNHHWMNAWTIFHLSESINSSVLESTRCYYRQYIIWKIFFAHEVNDKLYSIFFVFFLFSIPRSICFLWWPGQLGHLLGAGKIIIYFHFFSLAFLSARMRLYRQISIITRIISVIYLLIIIIANVGKDFCFGHFISYLVSHAFFFFAFKCLMCLAPINWTHISFRWVNRFVCQLSAIKRRKFNFGLVSSSMKFILLAAVAAAIAQFIVE